MDRRPTQTEASRALELSLPAERGAVSLASDLVEQFLHFQLTAEEAVECVRELLLVLQEALSNVIRHAYADRGGVMTIRVAVDGDQIEMRFRDIGAGFRPGQIATPTLDQPKVGGYGVFLMRTLMDHIEVRAMESESELILVRRRLIAEPVQ